MTSFKDMANKETGLEEYSNNIKPEFNALIELERRTQHGFRYKALNIVGMDKLKKFTELKF